jgi:transcriptional regulator with XRE-family HTH domain
LSEKGWTQAELARRSGVSPAQITRVLSGERGLGEQSILAIAEALKLPPDEVYRAAGLLPQMGDDPYAREAAHLIGLLSEDQKRSAIEILRTLVSVEERKKKK